MRKSIKITLIIIICLISLLILLLGGLFILTSNYKYVCERKEVGLIQGYSYEFNLFGKLKEFTYETSVLFESEESAKKYYDDTINLNTNNKERIKLDKDIVIFDNTTPEQKLGNNFFYLKKIHSDLDYTCKVVKK